MADLFPKHQLGAGVGLTSCAGTFGALVFNAGVGAVIAADDCMPAFITLALDQLATLIFTRMFEGRRHLREARAV